MPTKTDDPIGGGVLSLHRVARVSTVAFPTIDEEYERGDATPVPPRSGLGSGLDNRTAVLTRLGAPGHFDEQ